MKILILLATISTGLSAFAIRSVGNGGGDAEMMALKLFQDLKVIAPLCMARPEVCQTEKLSVKYQNQYLSSLREIQEIQFIDQPANVLDFVKTSQLIIERKSLYLDLDHAQSPFNILNILSMRISKMARVPNFIFNVDVTHLKKWSDGVYTLKLGLAEIIFFLSFDRTEYFLNDKIQQELGMPVYMELQSASNDYLIFKNINNNKIYISYLFWDANSRLTTKTRLYTID